MADENAQPAKKMSAKKIVGSSVGVLVVLYIVLGLLKVVPWNLLKLLEGGAGNVSDISLTTSSSTNNCQASPSPLEVSGAEHVRFDEDDRPKRKYIIRFPTANPFTDGPTFSSDTSHVVNQGIQSGTRFTYYIDPGEGNKCIEGIGIIVGH